MSKEIIPAELQDFANLMVEEILAKLRVKINNGGWTIDEQREVLDCVVAEQEVKHRLRVENASLRKQLEDARSEALEEAAKKLEREWPGPAVGIIRALKGKS